MRDVLLSVRSSNNTDLEQIEVLLPRRFLFLFRDLLILLLTKTLAWRDHSYDQNTLKLARREFDESLTESATALLRATERLSLPFDVGFESIRSADTLLGLIVENALNISCSDVEEPTNEGYDPRFDLEFTYRLYASQCLQRAKREASARVYEEVRLLDEEIDTIVNVLQDQKRVIKQMQEYRESSKQTLDIWVDQRIGDHLNEMITHFKTLHDYAEQAHEWTSNSIRVRGEDNSKAIYVFTFFTVVFLPLTFVVSTYLPSINFCSVFLPCSFIALIIRSSLTTRIQSGFFGMNVKDVRLTKHSSALFWAISVPTTFVVLMVCLFFVHMRFKLQIPRRCRRFLLHLYPSSWHKERIDIARRDRGDELYRKED